MYSTDNLILPVDGFIDLEMPLVNGFGVLSRLRKQTKLSISGAILRSSPEDQDMRCARELGASCYLIKPPTVHMLRSCWKQFSLSERAANN